MIHKIYSSLETFKELEFHKGLNILSAVRADTSTDRQTRNGAGKSSFLAIVNMLLGGGIGSNSIFKHDSLLEQWFGMDFDLRGNLTSVKRSGKPRSKTYIKTSSDLVFQYPRQSAFINDDYISISRKNWTDFLGSQIFNLPLGEENDALGRYKPTFRSLISYFTREEPDGFNTYERHFGRGSKYQYQVPLSYILGFDWRISQELQELRSAEDENVFPEIETSAELRTTIVIKENRYKELQSNLRRFRVLPEYREFENEANKITSQLGELSDQIMLDQRIIDDLKASMENEPVPEFERLEELYREANVILPDHVTSRYEDVKRFHASIVENRRLQLHDEIENAGERIRQNENRSMWLEKRYSEIMSILQPHGAIDQLVALESELRKLDSELVNLNSD